MSGGEEPRRPDGRRADGRRPDFRELEREIQRVAERARVDAQELADRLRLEASATAERVRTEAQATAERMRSEARAAGERVRSEAPRKAIHLAMIVIPLGILYLPLVEARRILMGVGLALVIGDLLKIHQPRLRTYFTRFFGELIRRHEHTEVTGSTYMIVSALLATYLFPPPIAAAALVYLIVGDTLAAMVGKAFGRTPLFGKSLEGFLAGFVSSFLAAWAIVPGISWPAHLAAALTAAVIEVAPIPVDDNFRIPLVAGLVLEWLA